MKALALALLWFAAEAVLDGARAYEEGRFEEAFVAWSGAVEAAGEDAAPELLYNLALAALRAGRWQEAEARAHEAFVRGGPEYRSRGDFVRGCVAFLRCEQAERLADQPEAEPFLFDQAIAQADVARQAFERVVVADPGQAPARRNLERALLKLAELRDRKAAAEARKREEEDRPEPPPGSEPTEEEEHRLQAALRELTPEQVLALPEKLRRKEQEKRSVRAAERRSPARAVERDW